MEENLSRLASILRPVVQLTPGSSFNLCFHNLITLLQARGKEMPHQK